MPDTRKRLVGDVGSEGRTILGHADPFTTKRYAHMAPDAMKQAMSVLDDSHNVHHKPATACKILQTPEIETPLQPSLVAAEGRFGGKMEVGPEGFEPSTHGLRVRCSTRLSYEPVSGISTTSSLLRHPPIVQWAQAAGSQRTDFPRGFTGALVPSARPAVDVVRADR